ncbi:MAG: hypothetical protein CL840_14850 [Crocinitomicaceae bacterium]|nr:hypothetical protein [Crocinitomicaceae bacterium]|tara:strand:+ start:153171 stop:153617 length:447 start_codon:yes stop_codon:yes gene_type:complete
MKKTTFILALALSLTACASIAKDKLLGITQLVDLADGAVMLINRNTYVREDGTCYQVDTDTRAVDGPGLKVMGSTTLELDHCPDFDSGYLPEYDTPPETKPIVRRAIGDCVQEKIVDTKIVTFEHADSNIQQRQHTYAYAPVDCPTNW